MKQKALGIVKTLIIGYLITFVMLLILSFLMYKLMLSDNLVTAGIIATYAVSCFVGGYVLANTVESRRVLFGALYALVYMAVLVIMSMIINKGGQLDGYDAAKTLVICLVSGIAGGFLS
ncbi:MAG: TIGR04086 family membrane protein [Lachnospira sp.]